MANKSLTSLVICGKYEIQITRCVLFNFEKKSKAVVFALRVDYY